MGNQFPRLSKETIRSVVLAYAEGKIELERPEPSGKGKDQYNGLKLAPSFLAFDFKNHKVDLKKPFYNAFSIARFLGWWSGDQVSPRVRNALAVLQEAEELDAEKDFKDMTKELGSET